MIRTLLTIALLFSVAAVEAQPNLAVETPPAGRVSIAEALRRGTEFLVEGQNADGSFGHHTSGRTYEILADVPGSHKAFRVATTALCFLALEAQPQRNEKIDKARKRALAYLLKHVRVKRANPVEMYNIWAFGYGLRALAAALKSGEYEDQRPQLLRRANSIVEALKLYQVPDGGWTYYDFDVGSYHPSGSSMSFTTATVLIAIHEAQEQGITVPEPMVRRAVRSIERCRKKNGSYLYGTYLRYAPKLGVNEPKGSSMRCSTCNLALKLHGADVSQADFSQGIEYLIDHHRFAIAGLRRPIPHESWYQVSGYFYLYGHQYAALCLDYVPAEKAKEYWPPLAQAILKARQQDGSFWDYPLYGYHKYYGTGYAVLSLAQKPGSE